jgi:hypothetical protein
LDNKPIHQQAHIHGLALQELHLFLLFVLAVVEALNHIQMTPQVEVVELYLMQTIIQ